MIIVGHRGAKGLMPENTLPSIQKALDHHVDEVEFDLRTTRDQIVILHHDPYLTDGNGKRNMISELTYKQLLQHKPDLATFKQALELIGLGTPVYIEIKPEAKLEPITKIIDEMFNNGWPSDHFAIASFDQKILVKLHKKYPDLEIIVNETWSGVRAQLRAKALNTNRISMDQRWLWSGFIKMMSKKYRLGAYTLNDPAKARRWAKNGLYAAITDYPDLVKR